MGQVELYPPFYFEIYKFSLITFFSKSSQIVYKQYFLFVSIAGCQPLRTQVTSPQDQSDGATLLPLLEHVLEGAHPTLLDMH